MNVNEFVGELSRLGMGWFTVRDAARVVGKDASYVKLFLGRAVKQGRVVRVERGKFCLPGAGPFEVAEAFGVGYVSFLSALAFHGLTSQVPRTVQLACLKQKKGKTVGETRYVFVKLASKRFFGFKRYGGVTVAEPEKAVLDGLYQPMHLPVSEAAEVVAELDGEKLLEFAARFDSGVVAKRLGFLLERAGKNAGGLKELISSKYELLNPELPSKGTRNVSWRIIENEGLA